MNHEGSDTVLELNDVTFQRQGKLILDRVNLEIRRGEHWALLGPNGAGKSTILGFCGALTHPSTGSVHILGHQLGRTDLQTLRKKIGHVNPRHPLRSPLSIIEVVLTGLTGSIETPMRWEPSAEQTDLARALVDSIGLQGKQDLRWPTLSQGERGRTLIARALIAEPEILLLDEPSTGLDVAAREQLLETISGLEHSHPELSSILVTHHLEELPSSTSHALLISHGKIVASGAVDDVITSENISLSFEHPIEVEYRNDRWSARAVRSVPSF
ncbi:MAG: ATP-binding cassette domain-containing protein [Microbacteriaceae bacterium]